jgi:hypothetical protein
MMKEQRMAEAAERDQLMQKLEVKKKTLEAVRRKNEKLRRQCDATMQRVDHLKRQREADLGEWRKAIMPGDEPKSRR